MTNPVYLWDREQFQQAGVLKVVELYTAIAMIRDLISIIPSRTTIRGRSLLDYDRCGLNLILNCLPRR